MKDDFFVGIYDPLDVRRNLLESSKEIVKSLQSHDTLARIRKDKLRYYEEMRNIMDELTFLTTKLKEKLPQSHLREKVPIGVKIRNVPNEEMNELENEFRKIEKEFNDMS